tara:strand:- start:715 stop:2319 length:1605 start_codon:yes stop_codon:yes gene_type:complete
MATTAGTLLSNSTFKVPAYQREYSWLKDEVAEFWNDLKTSLNGSEGSYFLGLVILTDDDGVKQVVDGQQRIITLTLLASAIYHEANERGRKALAERIQADFLKSIDYETDETNARVTLSDPTDNETLQEILDKGMPLKKVSKEEDSLSARMQDAFKYLRERLKEDLAHDPFKRLGAWTDFITNKVYFAVFVHPDSASAYRVFEIINTRGKELTTADLLKNYILSQTKQSNLEEMYQRWKKVAQQFSDPGTNSFVQYIRHVVTVEGGHILPKDLYDFLSGRAIYSNREPPRPMQLMTLLEENLPIYMQMVDPSLDGPSETESLKIYEALNSLGVISVRPILLAMAHTPNPLEGMTYILELVVRRIIVGNLGTGNVERRFGEAARKIKETREWASVYEDLKDLNPSEEEFAEQLKKRSLNKSTLSFIRRSIICQSMTPEKEGTLHYIRPLQSEYWEGFTDEHKNYWGNTIGNTILADVERRPNGASTWEGFKENLLKHAIEGEWIEWLQDIDEWTAEEVIRTGEALSNEAVKVWYS